MSEPHSMLRTERSRQGRRALTSGMIGNSIEYYEFSIYGLASALVFPKLFFPNLSPTVGTFVSFATFAIAFVARPVGGLLFGHFGDKLGRKGSLITSLSMMGGATFLIGALPSASVIGVWAPVLLITLRVVQGLSVGGEYAGSVLMTLEHASPGRRGLLGALISSGLGWGTLVANLVFLVVSQLPDNQFMSWGWRIPFLVSIVLVGICMFIRLRLDESPEFEAEVANEEPARAPLVSVLREHPKAVVAVTLSILGTGVLYYIGSVYGVAYAKRTGISKSAILTAIMAVNVVIIVGMPFFGWLGDRTNRRAVLLISFVGMAVTPWIWFPMLNTHNLVWMILGYCILFIPFAANYSALPATLAHAFPAKVRYTGMAIGINFGALMSSSMAPMVATLLQSKFGGWAILACYISLASGIALIGASQIRERYVSADVHDQDAGGGESRGSGPSAHAITV